MRRERGFALITVVLLMIGLAVLATGLLFGASQHAAVVTSMHDLARARRAAEAGVAIALAQWNGPARSREPVGASVPIVEAHELEPGLRVSARSRRVARGVWLVTATAEAKRGALAPIRQGAARVVHSADLDSIGRALDAALIVGRVLIGPDAVVDGLAGTGASDTAAAALCASWGLAGAALRAPPDSVAVAAAAHVTGVPPLLPDSMVSRYRERLGSGSGSIDFDRLRAAAATLRSAVVRPGPVEHGAACDTTESMNWGAPEGACATHRVLVHAPDRLDVSGGYGQGILIADGDLVLDGGFQFRGLIVALGTVTVRDAAVQGAVIAGRVEMQAGSISLDRCALADALVAAGPLRTAYPPARSWLPSFD